MWTIALDSRERAYRKEGIETDAKQRSISKTLLWLSTGCEAGSIITGLVAGDSSAGIWTSFGLLGAAIIVETCNALGPRIKWSGSQVQGFKNRRVSLDEPTVLPVVAPVILSDEGEPAVYLGIRIDC